MEQKSRQDLTQFVEMREIWDRCAIVEIDLESTGVPVTVENIWRALTHKDGEPELPMPNRFAQALAAPAYRDLADIKKRMVALPETEHLKVARKVCREGTLRALLSINETLITKPDSIPISERRQLAKAFASLEVELSRLEEGEVNPTGTKTGVNAALAEEQAMDEALERVPEGMRERMKKVYQEERMKDLRTRQALHLIKDNESMSHAG